MASVQANQLLSAAFTGRVFFCAPVKAFLDADVMAWSR
jgi:hypothetical protein